MDWLDANYGWKQANSWRLMNLRGGNYQNDPVYLYWIQNIAQNDPAFQAERLENALGNLVSTGVISDKEAENYYLEVARSGDWGKVDFFEYLGNPDAYLDFLGADQQTKQYLTGYTNSRDLADRINSLNVDDETKANIYDSLLFGATPADTALRGAQGRYQTEQEKARQAELQERMGIVPTLNENVTALSNLPYVTDADRFNLYSKNRSILNAGLTENERLGMMNKFIVGAGTKAATRAAGEEQSNQALLAGTQNINQSGFYPSPTGEPVYTGDSSQTIIDRYLKSTGYAPGTRLRSFIESKLSDIYSSTKGAREQWIQDSMTPFDAPPTYEEEQMRLQNAVDKYNRIAESASSAAYTGGTYWGEGGLKQMALDTAARTQKTLSGLNPEDYWQGNLPASNVGEDPLVAALRGLTSKKVKAEYNRLPGVGVTSTLAPALRF